MMLLLAHLKGQAQQITLHVERAGTLPGMIDESRLPYITDLKLTGELNGTDIRLIRTLTQENLQILDLSEARILGGGAPYKFAYYTSNDIIGEYMFYNSDYYGEKPSVISKIILPKSTLRIDKGAFRECKKLESIDISNSVTSIGDLVFCGCTRLTNIDIPNSVTSIGENTFSECTSLKSINISNSLTSIGSQTFYGCTSLTNIDIPNSVKNIGVDTFHGCTNLKDINISNSLTRIGMQTFYECTSLTNIDIPNSVTSIDNCAFFRCTSLTNINIPNSVTSIEYQAFYGCTSLTDIVIPNSVTSIGDDAFYKCTSLTDINIPNSVTSIENQAFYECDNLKSIYLNSSNPPTINKTTLPQNEDLTIYIPRGSYTAYWLSYWGNYNLVEYDPTDIQGVTTSAHNSVKKYFSIDGRPLPGPCKGVNIIQDTDGKTRKAWIP